MTLNREFPFNPSYKVHILIGAVLGILLGFILIVLQPFNINNSEYEYHEILFMGFGFVKFINYLVAHFIAVSFYNKSLRWTWWNEIIFLLISSVSAGILGYIYLDIILEKKPLSILRLLVFCFYMVLPVFPLILFPKLVLRYLFSKKSNLIKEENNETEQVISTEKIQLKGTYAADFLTVTRKQLLYIKSIDNYIVVFYMDGQIKNKMLRANLSHILTQAPFLTQPHRSYLINPDHSFTIKGNSQKANLSLDGLNEVIPIARSAYKMVKTLFT